jgi:ATP-dependent DNA helicase HFM1/MER3
MNGYTSADQQTVSDNGREGFGPISVVDSLPPCFRGVFTFRYFNSIQAECFHTLYHTNDSAVVASPTGSGKTTLFALAMLGMLRKGLSTNHHTGNLVLDPRERGKRKAIYVAPMRSLVQEKAQEWKENFGKNLGLVVNEFTGEHWANGIEAIEASDIILTTPERFDSITRRNNNEKHQNRVLSDVKLVLLDEVHLLADHRGSSLEAIVSRLKMSQQQYGGELARFVACSATFKNVEDVATWLGAPPAGLYSFGNEMRPVPLDINIKTYHSKSNEYMFNKKLDDHVFNVLGEYSNNKPALCFCGTKADTIRLAKKLASEYRNESGSSFFVRDAQHKSFLLDASRRVREESLKRVLREGVGFHNADLCREDKAAVEELFYQKQLPVVATTSTLAMGMNLPAYLVIIKGVRVYRGNSQFSRLDYSTILQMIGRAGRPQFDAKGVAVIMAEARDEHSLQNILNLSEIVESSLLECICECLNAEICSGIVTDLDTALQWLKTTYLYCRIKRNPTHYGVPFQDTQIGTESIDVWLKDKLLGSTVSKLVSRGMVAADGHRLASSVPGILMAENYVRLDTMSLISTLGPESTMEDLAWVISNSEEVRDALVVRRNEKKWLNKINASPFARYSVKDPQKPGAKLKRIQLPHQKAFALIMYELSSECRSMIRKDASNDSGGLQSLIRDASTVNSKGLQICKCIIKFFEATANMANALCDALVFKKSLERKLWPDDPLLITQVKGIGETIASRLISKGDIRTLSQILSTDARRLEILGEMRPPQGTVMKDNASLICPMPLKVVTRLHERNNTLLANINVLVDGTSSDGRQWNTSNTSLSRWCRIVVFESTTRTLLTNRRVKYSSFANQNGYSIHVDTCSPANAGDDGKALVVRIIDDCTLGLDIRSSTPLLPSTEAQSAIKSTQKAILKTNAGRVSPNAYQSKLKFEPKKRQRVTTDDLPQMKRPPLENSPVSKFQSSYQKLMEGFEIFFDSPEGAE